MVQQAEREAAVPVVAERVRDLRSEVADPQVVEKAKRRRFSASYKLKILEEVDRNPHRSGAILRREGLYSSHLSAWRKQREEGALKALDKKRGPKGKSAEQVQIEKLAREKARLRARAVQSERDHRRPKKACRDLGRGPSEDHGPGRGQERMTVLVRELGEVVGVARACTALGVPRPSYYRRRRPALRRPEKKRPPPPRALGPERTARGRRGAALGALRRSRAGAGRRGAAGRRHLPLLGPHDVPDSEQPAARSVSAEIGSSIRATSVPSSWRLDPIRCGRGTSPSFAPRRSGRTTTCTCCSTSTAATRWAGCWRTANPASSPPSCSSRASSSKASSPTRSPYTPTAARRRRARRSSR